VHGLNFIVPGRQRGATELGTLSRLLRATGLKAPKRQKKEELQTSINRVEVISNEEEEIFKEVLPYTLTDASRVLSLIYAVRYIERNCVSGAIVECGVWKGGSMMAVARTLLEMGVTDRQLYLCDTFHGMPPPADRDLHSTGVPAEQYFKEQNIPHYQGCWCFATLDEVKQNLNLTGYPVGNIHYVKGKVEDTLPEQAPDVVSLLRLDTDFYESTRHEMVHLFPRLSVGGVLIVDDYVSWRGSREAVDEYLRDHKVRMFLNPVGGGAGIGVKQAP
jgi:O-methyltransferase